MQFVNDPIKSRRVFILMLVLTIIFFLAGCAMGYLYYLKDKNYKTLASEKESISAQLLKLQDDLTKSSADLKAENDKLKTNKKTLEDQAAAGKTKSALAKKYLAVLDYVCQTITKYNGMDGWTDADYQQGRQLAQATNDSNFVNTVDWAWNRKDISQIIRLNGFLQAVSKGVAANLP